MQLTGNSILMPKGPKPKTIVAFLIALCLFVAGPSHAQSKFDHAGAASLASRLGISVTRLWLDHDDIQIPPSELLPEDQHKHIEEALKRYVAMRNGYAGVSTAASAMQVGMDVTIGGALLFAGPQVAAAVPLILIGAASHISLDLANAKVEKIGKDRATALLATIKDDLVREAGVKDFDALTAEPDLLRETIMRSDRFLKDIKRRAQNSGDPDFINMATDMLQQAAIATDAATLGAVAMISKDVSEMEAKLGEFVQEVNNSNKRIGDRLEQHHNMLQEFDNDLIVLHENVLAMDRQIQRLGRDQDLIADFMFSGLPPDQKVTALRTGLMDDRFRCPKGTSNCNPAEIRTAMVKRYEAEARIMKNVEVAGNILQGINDIQTIVGNLGIDIGKDGNKALQIASGAVSAYIGVMSGNPLGAIASITSIFGKKSDPDAERFRIMMEYLKKQFGIINEKLDAVLNNQQTILDAVISVAEQLEQIYRNLDGRLENMEWEQRRISEKLKELIWAEWRSCFSMYRYALAPNPAEGISPFVNPKTLRFETFGDVRAVIDQRGEQISDCLDTVLKAMDSLSATRWFGAFLDARHALSVEGVFDQGTLVGTVADEANRWSSIERLHLENVVEPAHSIVSDWSKRKKVSASTLLQLQTRRISNASQLGLVMDAQEKGERFNCNRIDEIGRATRDLVCIPNTNTDEIAEDLMRFAINLDILLEIADWMTVLSQVANLYSPNKSHFAESLEDLATFGGISLGEEITRKAVAMMALAIAYYSRIYGGMTALAIAEAILSDKADERHSKVLLNNPYLAENTALLLLHLKRQTWNLEAESSRPSFENIYSQALLHARTEEANRFMPLYALFGRDHSFISNEEGKIGFDVEIGDAHAFLPLPPPIRLSKGQFIFPPRYHALTNRQNLLIDTYIDYRLGSLDDLANVVLQR